MQELVWEFERLDIRYLVGWSLASSLHGIPKATHDVDLVADITYEHIPLLVEALESDFYIDAEMIREAIQHRISFNVIHLDTMFKAGISIFSRSSTGKRCLPQISSVLRKPGPKEGR